jgi:AraC family transcriptional regulator of adaptative response/methylated-DNA-[protein]-cysteine methyltransferase
MILNTAYLSTPIGKMFASCSHQGICLIEFIDETPRIDKEMGDLIKRLNATVSCDSHPHLQRLETQLSEYFTGARRAFELPLHMPGTPFQQKVWQALLTIPYGTTRSYAEQAQYIARPTAIRAVARANGMNKIAVVVPCHRVLASDGALTGYAGGLARKQWLLDLERARR